MSSLGLWLRARPAARAVGLAAALGAVLLGLALLPHVVSAPAQVESRTLPPAPALAPMDDSPSPSPTATVAVPSPSPSALAQAETVARAFLGAYASSRYDDPPGALRARLRPHDSDRLDALLGQGAGDGADAQRRAAVHEVASASLSRLTVHGLAPDGRLVVVGLVSRTVRSDQGSSTSGRYLELFLAGTAAGWRVDEVVP